MSNSPSIIIEQLRVIGINKNYDINFKEGVNIIWGDLDCGKSSILNLISYSLGASSIDTYGQLEAKARFCQLTVYLNDEKYIFVRNIFDAKEFIRCYKGSIDDNLTPSLLAPNLDQIDNAPDGYVSFYVLELLGLPITKIKVSPSQLDSTMNRVGFKDILKFIHLKQKDIASDSLLDMNNGSRYVKHKEVLKYLLNIHNETVSVINAEISENKSIEKNREKEKESIIKFLRDTDFDFEIDIDKELQAYTKLVSDVDDEIEKLKNSHKNVLKFSLELKAEIDEINKSLSHINKKRPILTEDIEKYVKLKNTYDKERKSISLSLKLESKFKISKETEISCPLCNEKSKCELADSHIPMPILINEKKSLDRKTKSLGCLIDNIRCELNSLDVNESKLNLALNDIQNSFNHKYSKEVSALIESISMLEKQKLEIYSSSKLLARDKKFIDRINKLDDTLSNLEKVIIRLQGELKKAEEKCLNPKDVISDLNDIFVKLMELSGLTDMTNLKLDDRLDYIVRNKQFVKLTSGGVRTISSIAIFLSKLIYAMKFDSNLPTLFMLDTPGNNIGRKRDKTVDSDEASDPIIYENIYKRLELLSDLSKRTGTKFQVIVVDNDLADTAFDNDDFYIAKRFSKTDPQFDSGLINDFQ
ncbi:MULTISPECIES: hypothetical protein [Vibrio]|uniref:Rad50/SbcC-type AAA domain-containing protein n=1 Tax=Vibrio kanaloae TaxID=170673 RepID=A0ABV4L9D7_9VIBR|nr:hypothetical protein [Vibrio kanaloae]OEF15399.1 hypothetical protein A132_16155 [Vibrio kanaloae 5S-149]UIJ43231.1 hypothetical protein LWM38_16510 [Vibrio kanaloae]